MANYRQQIDPIAQDSSANNTSVDQNLELWLWRLNKKIFWKS